MPKYTVQASYPLDAYVRLEVAAATPEAAIAKARQMEEEGSNFWDDQEFDFETSGDVSFRVEADAGIVELEELGHVHRMFAAGPAMLRALKLALPVIQEELDVLLDSFTPRGDLRLTEPAERQMVEPVKAALDTVKAAISLAENGPPKDEADFDLRFTTIDDVAPQLSGHADRFKSPDAFERACYLVWHAARHDFNGASISRERLDAIMNEAVEKGGE